MADIPTGHLKKVFKLFEAMPLEQHCNSAHTLIVGVIHCCDPESRNRFDSPDFIAPV